MYTELTESFFKEFPEMRGRVAIYNFAEPREAELAKIHKNLGLKENEIPETKSEMATLHMSSDDKPRSVAWGVDPAAYGGVDKLTPKDIDFLAWHLTHEMFHTVDMTADLRKENDPQLHQGRNQDKWNEAMADAGRLSVYMKNMGANAEVNVKLQGFVAGYDASAPAWVYSETETPYAGDDIETQVNTQLPNKYDNGEILLKTMNSVQPERMAQSYAFTGWKDSFETILQNRADWAAVREDNIQLQASSGLVMKEAGSRFAGQAKRDLEPMRDEMVKSIGMGPEAFVENFFGGSKGYLYARSQDNPTLAKASQIMLQSQSQYVDWLRERQEILPNAARMVAAQDFLAGRTDKLGAYESRSLTDIECMEKSYKSYQKTGDPLDKRAAEIFAASYDGADLNEKAALLKKLEAEPSLPKAEVSVQSPQREMAPVSPALMR